MYSSLTLLLAEVTIVASSLALRLCGVSCFIRPSTFEREGMVKQDQPPSVTAHGIIRRNLLCIQNVLRVCRCCTITELGPVEDIVLQQDRSSWCTTSFLPCPECLEDMLGFPPKVTQNTREA